MYQKTRHMEEKPYFVKIFSANTKGSAGCLVWKSRCDANPTQCYDVLLSS